ncbi:nucleotidyltransferase family protein [Thiospirochaeta perfilievii]|uniref:nucleotidyltransferase family protein n=1 Tax=Thiospirochaeta perfilievii TaxID=252967 RepID=UPI003CCC6CF3
MNSDVDILIEIARPVKIDLLDLVAIEQELSEELNTPVKLVVKSVLKSIIKESVLSEVKYLFYNSRDPCINSFSYL